MSGQKTVTVVIKSQFKYFDQIVNNIRITNQPFSDRQTVTVLFQKETTNSKKTQFSEFHQSHGSKVCKNWVKSILWKAQ